MALSLLRECGKPRHEALVHEVTTLLDLTGWLCKHAPHALMPERVALHLIEAPVERGAPRPARRRRRAVAVELPARHPHGGSVLASLVAGNACVVKPSEVTPLVMLEAKRIYDSTGLPEDLFAVVGVGPASTGQALLDAAIDYCVFTGGVETGRKVAAACGQRLIPCVMALGGKAPLLACEDCDLERTARAVVCGGFAISGQTCISVERVYAHSRIYAPLLERVRALVGELVQGDPAEGYVDLGAITFPGPIDVARRHVEDALKKGARLLCGGHSLPGRGQFFEATVLADCDPTMTVMREEIFGPVVPIMRVASDDEAVALANDSHLGLNAYVFTRDKARARRLAESLEAGSVVVNDVLSNYAAVETPFGGIKQSGFGRVHGVEALRAMCLQKHLSFDRVTPPSRDPFWFPYTAQSFRWLQRGTRMLFGGGTLARRIGQLL